jgi:hypothetical protein
MRPAPARPLREKVLLWLVMTVAAAATFSFFFGLPLYAVWAGGDARAFLTKHFAQVRKDPASVVRRVTDPETLEAYRAVAASNAQDLPWFTNSSTRGVPFRDVRTRRCLNATLTGSRGAQDLGVLVEEAAIARAPPMAVVSMSVRRGCTCKGKGRPCRMEESVRPGAP